MNDLFEKDIKLELNQIQRNDNLRSLKDIKHEGNYIIFNNKKLLNLSSNDYLGLAADTILHEEFFATYNIKDFVFSASSSRLLTGNFNAHKNIERLLANLYGTESALIFNSGYAANIGILPAICTKKSLIVADKLVHASLIDGMRLASSKFVRYNHNDYEHLEKIIDENNADFDRIIIVTESIFSMDGDIAEVSNIVQIKKKYSNVLIYLDEAHAVGVRGRHGLGIAEEKNCLKDIDFLIGTFGKAIASSGAFVVCSSSIKTFLVNKMRSFIFSTAIPPINALWTSFIMNKIDGFYNKRIQLNEISSVFRNEIKNTGYVCPSESHIVPIIVGESQIACSLSENLCNNGFYVLPIRPPTVPINKSRLRFSLNAAMNKNDVEKLISLIKNNK